ncbi:MAG: hypothetical protein V1911_02725, partial [Candidatus Micrarchaeota archaeon]
SGKHERINGEWYADLMLEKTPGVTSVPEIVFTKSACESTSVAVRRLGDCIDGGRYEPVFPSLNPEGYHRFIVSQGSKGQYVVDCSFPKWAEQISRYRRISSCVADGYPADSRGFSVAGLTDELNALIEGSVSADERGEFVGPKQAFLNIKQPWSVRERSFLVSNAHPRLVASFIDRRERYDVCPSCCFDEIEIRRSNYSTHVLLRVNRFHENDDGTSTRGVYAVINGNALFGAFLKNQQDELRKMYVERELSCMHTGGASVLAPQRDCEKGQPIQDLSQTPLYDDISAVLNSFMTMTQKEFQSAFPDYSPQYLTYSGFCASEFGALANATVAEVRNGEIYKISRLFQ